MSEIACAVVCGDVVQVVTGHRPKHSWDEYQSDPLYNTAVNQIVRERGDSVPFLFAATEHVYEIPKELVGIF